MNLFEEYAQHGWKICRVDPKGTTPTATGKGPNNRGWNSVEGVNQTTAAAANLVGAGLCHAYSGTCAIDIDRFDEAAVFLKEHGIDLADLLADPNSVQILSGRANRGKLIYALTTPLPSKSVCNGAFELRCGASTGNTMQDVLPPTIHPDTGKPYEWKGDWRTLPPIPPTILALWQLLLVKDLRSAPQLAAVTPETAELRDLLKRRDPSCGYDEWLKVGMAVHHGTGGSDEGLAIWDEWSAVSDKYPGLATLRSHWASFRGSDTPVTVDSLRRLDRAAAEDFEDLTAVPLWPEENLAEQPPASGGLRSLSLLELFQRPEPDWIIRGLLPEAAIGAIYGQPSAGKTFTSVDIALSIALGDPWRGREVRQGNVYYVAAEDDRGVQIRFAAGLAARGVTDAPVRVLPTAPMLRDKSQQKALMEDIKRHLPLSIVFIDTLAAVTPGGDENAVKDMSELVNFCYRVHKATGAVVMLIHHEGKTPGRGMRGSSALAGACDVLWEVSKDDIQHELRIEKLKNAEIGATFGFRLQPVANSCIVEWI